LQDPLPVSLSDPARIQTGPEAQNQQSKQLKPDLLYPVAIMAACSAAKQKTPDAQVTFDITSRNSICKSFHATGLPQRVTYETVLDRSVLEID
jgi:hypothetical protein